MPYQKCEEGYEDKCKETPTKVITMRIKCKERKKLFSAVSLCLHMSLENLYPPDWGEGDEASMRVAGEGGP